MFSKFNALSTLTTEMVHHEKKKHNTKMEKPLHPSLKKNKNS